MQSPNIPDQDQVTSGSPVSAPTDYAESTLAETPRAIGELAIRPDFPQCALGALVDLRGFVGVVIEIVNQSIKVRSEDGITQRFNSQRLKMLFAPPEPIRPAPTMRHTEPTKTDSTTSPAHSTPSLSARASRPAPAVPARVFIDDPDFTAPVQPINVYATQPDFPKCAYGKHVDIVGYTGVVVEIVKGSLKIQSASGATRSYNAVVLKSLYGQA